MNKYREYERLKREIAAQCKDSEEYERLIKKIIERLGI